jgi:hypothetical protein
MGVGDNRVTKMHVVERGATTCNTEELKRLPRRVLESAG